MPSSTPIDRAAYPPLVAPLRVEQVPGSQIYYALGQPAIPSQANEGNTSNAGFVVTADAVLVFDALGTPSLGLALLREIQKRSPAPIRCVVLSHYHADHIYGLQAFKDFADPVVIAQDKSADYLEPNSTDDESAAPRLAQRRAALAPWVNAKTRIVEPDIYFVDQITLALGKRRCVVRYAGPAHSQSDRMMWVEPDGVLFAGDVVQNGRIPFIGSATVSTTHWLAELDVIAALKPRFIIPGHGRPSTDVAPALAFTRGYLVFVREQMSRAVANWTDFDTAYDQVDWSKYRDLPAFDAINRGNAYRVFLELEATELAPAPKGAAAAKS